MKSGKCPKCGSRNVRSGANIEGKKGGASINVHDSGSNTVPISKKSWWRRGDITEVALDNYICVDCGHVESYISDQEALRKIAEKWPYVGSEE